MHEGVHVLGCSMYASWYWSNDTSWWYWRAGLNCSGRHWDVVEPYNFSLCHLCLIGDPACIVSTGEVWLSIIWRADDLIYVTLQKGTRQVTAFDLHGRGELKWGIVVSLCALVPHTSTSIGNLTVNTSPGGTRFFVSINSLHFGFLGTNGIK